MEAKDNRASYESLSTHMYQKMPSKPCELGTRKERNTMTTETKCLHRYEYDDEKKAFFCVYCGHIMPAQVLEVPF